MDISTHQILPLALFVAESGKAWELLFAPHALDDLRAQVMGWTGQLPFPSVIEWMASSSGLRVRLYLPADVGSGVVFACAAMTGQHSRWRELGKMIISDSIQVLIPSSRLPSLIVSSEESDPLLAIGSRLVNSVHEGKEIHLRAWLLGKESELQGRLRSLVSYSYGTEGGVENNTPNLTISWRTKSSMNVLATSAVDMGVPKFREFCFPRISSLLIS